MIPICICTAPQAIPHALLLGTKKFRINIYLHGSHLFININACFMKNGLRNILCSSVFILSFLATANAQDGDDKIRVIMFGAHPDDCDQGGGGTAILFAKMGYAVKFVSVTNGDAGHQTMKGTELAKRRYAEAQEAGKRFGVTYDVLDNHDGM